MKYIDFGTTLKNTRLSDNKSLKVISDSTGFSIPYLSDIENGKKLPKKGCALRKLSEGYSITFDNILKFLLEEIRREGNNGSVK